MRFASVSLILLFISACAFGAAEFKIYSQAFEVQYVEGEKVLDQVAIAERKLVQQQISRSTGIRTFDPDESRLYLKVGDPPLTGSIRASVAAVKNYNDALSGLATGEAASAVRTELSSASSTLAKSLSGLATATSVDAEFLATISSRIGNVLGLLEVIERAGNRAAFREQLVRAHPEMKALMITLREGTSVMFNVVKLGYTDVGSLEGVDGVNAQNFERLEEFREQLAGWVILIDQSILAMDRAVIVAASPNTGSDLTGLIEASVEIEVLAEAIKAARN